MGIELNDEALTLLYGQVSLTLGYMAYLVATNEGLAKMANGFFASVCRYLTPSKSTLCWVIGLGVNRQVRHWLPKPMPLVISLMKVT